MALSPHQRFARSLPDLSDLPDAPQQAAAARPAKGAGRPRNGTGRTPSRASAQGRATRAVVDHLLVARSQDDFDTAIADAVAWLQHYGDDSAIRFALSQAHDAQRALRRLGRLL